MTGATVVLVLNLALGVRNGRLLNCLILGILFQSTRAHSVIDMEQLKPGRAVFIQLQGCSDSSLANTVAQTGKDSNTVT